MKKILFISLALITNFLVAQTSSITVFSEEGEPFYVVLNGARQNDAPSTNVKITDLSKPNYLVKIIFEDQTIPTINENVYLLDFEQKRANLTYNLKRDRKKRMKMSLNSFDYDVEQTKKTEVVKYHEVENISETANAPTKTTEEKVNINLMGIDMNTSVKETGENVDMNINIGGINTSVKATTTTTTTSSIKTKPSVNTSQKDTSIYNDVKINKPKVEQEVAVKAPTQCRNAMTSTDFQKAKSSIDKQSFAESKLKVAKQITNANCLSTSQIVEVIGLFSFEGNKLDFAKFAYAKCVDKDNYYQVNDAFSFSSSTDELVNYIENLKN